MAYVSSTGGIVTGEVGKNLDNTHMGLDGSVDIQILRHVNVSHPAPLQRKDGTKTRAIRRPRSEKRAKE
eukprot:1239484-Pyramimonas_sp.AAC.1